MGFDSEPKLSTETEIILLSQQSYLKLLSDHSFEVPIQCHVTKGSKDGRDDCDKSKNGTVEDFL